MLAAQFLLSLNGELYEIGFCSVQKAFICLWLESSSYKTLFVFLKAIICLQISALCGADTDRDPNYTIKTNHVKPALSYDAVRIKIYVAITTNTFVGGDVIYRQQCVWLPSDW